MVDLPLSFVPLHPSESLHVYLNGVEQYEGVDWTYDPVTNKVTVLSAMDARSGDLLEARYAHMSQVLPPPTLQMVACPAIYRSNRVIGYGTTLVDAYDPNTAGQVDTFGHYGSGGVPAGPYEDTGVAFVDNNGPAYPADFRGAAQVYLLSLDFSQVDVESLTPPAPGAQVVGWGIVDAVASLTDFEGGGGQLEMNLLKVPLTDVTIAGSNIGFATTNGRTPLPATLAGYTVLGGSANQAWSDPLDCMVTELGVDGEVAVFMPVMWYQVTNGEPPLHPVTSEAHLETTFYYTPAVVWSVPA